MRGIVFCLLLGVALCGCASAPPPQAAALPPSVPAQPAISGIMADSFGRNLDETDRQIAFDTQVAALEKGQRQTWRGKGGTYGFVEPGAETARPDGACRDYTHRIYVGGRPQSARGTACRNASGTWKFVS